MSEMVDRVAKQLWMVAQDWDTREIFENLPDYGQDFWRDRARAAISTMREPTQAMLEAVKPWPKHWLRTDPQITSMQAAYVADQMAFTSEWQTAIDAALEDTPGC